jgi:anthranilate synthase/aminodeoxychorismate synthase-like glutamine amidotransferase
LVFDLKQMAAIGLKKRILFIDNLDSFTYNIVHYLSVGGAQVDVVRIDEIVAVDQVGWLLELQKYDGYVVGPGPGQPHSHPMLMTTLGWSIGKLPILGVCLGLQAIGQAYGWELTHGDVPVHGKPSFIKHSNEGIFQGLTNPMQVGRYHSLVVKPPSTGGPEPRTLRIEATCDGAVMAVSDSVNQIWAVQFHPESILTPQGQLLINAWLKLL